MADQSDRHKSARTYKSGSQKRNSASDRKKKAQETVAKMPKIYDMFKHSSTKNVEGTSVKDDKEISDVVAVGDGHMEAEVMRDPEDEAGGRKDQDDEAEGSKDQDDEAEARKDQDNEAEGKKHQEDETKAEESEQGLSPENDIGVWPHWPEHSSKDFLEYWIKKDKKSLQNCDAKLLALKSWVQKDGNRYRKCQPSMFERHLKNGEIVNRSWLCFSPAKGKVYCYVCKLMGTSEQQLTGDGYCDWKHSSTRLSGHETSKDHLESVLALACRARSTGRIDMNLAKEVEQVEQYWCKVLKRLVSVLKFVCERGLALRGDNETIGSANNGNYLGLLELLAQYDDFLHQHILEHGNRGRGHTNYLSSTICEELVQLMAREVLAEIISRVKTSKYYSISLDSTVDESHVDQLTLIFRYMENTTPIERFVTFMPNQGHRAQEMFDGLMNFLNLHKIDIKNCRGQSYDNASAMSGRYNGLQAKVAAENKLATWIPCAGHSLNLVGKASVECIPAAVAFFDLLENIYVFFTASTHRYKILTDLLKLVDGPVYVPKRVTTTRWSCKADATKAFVQGYPHFKEALLKLAEHEDEMPKVRCEANGLFEFMCKLETGIYAVFWHDILNRVNGTSHVLQSPKLDLNTAVASVKSLMKFIEEKRECFDAYERQGVEKSGTTSYVQKRQRRRNVRLNPVDYGREPEADLSPSQKFRVENFLPVIDQFVSSLDQRLSAYEELANNFGFLGHLEKLTAEEIEQAAGILVDKYNNDLEDSLGIELIQFAEFSKVFEEENDKIGRHHFLYKLIIEKCVKDTFPNVEAVLRMYLVLMVTNCSSERSFSKMKIIKNRLRTSMTHERLSDLAIMSIEYDMLRELDFSNLVKEFAKQKSRKVPGLL